MRYKIAAILLFASSMASATGLHQLQSNPPTITRATETYKVAKTTPVVVSTAPVDLIADSLAKVVTIEVHGIIDDYESIFSTYTTKQPVTWYGSGSLITKDGVILSCNHLFIRKLEDRYIVVKTSTDKKYMGLLLSQNDAMDLSLVKIFPLHDLPYFELGKPVVRGQKVLAFGAPLTYSKTVSFGYIQNLDVDLEKNKRTMHSASINPGNSGGPLITEDGKLVGVNVSILLANFFMRAEGMGMAVRLSDIQDYLKD